MKFLSSIQDKYGYSDYEIAQVRYLLITLASELSKFLIFALLWGYRGQLREYLFAIFIFFMVRSSSGGIHFKKYISCLLGSFLYLLLCINVLPLLILTKWIKLLVLFFCILLTHAFSPVVSKYRIPPDERKRRSSQREIFVVIFFYFIAMYIMRPNSLLDIGFWCIVLHTIQLIIAHIAERRRHNEA